VAVRKTYAYKISRNGLFLGLLQNVRSPFTYTQQLNTTYVQTVIEVGVKAYTAGQDVSYLMTESGDYLTTESGDYIVTQRAVDVIGSSADSILIRENNDIEIVEYSSNNLNGKTVFKGWINIYDAGNMPGSDVISITCVSHGFDLDHTVLQATGSAAYTQSSDDNTYADVYHDSTGAENWVFETFAGSANSISALKMKVQDINGVGGIQAQIMQMTGSYPVPGADPVVGEASNIVDHNSIGGTKQDVLFTFNNPVQLATGTTYYIYVYANYYGDFSLNPWFKVYGASGNPYANGNGAVAIVTVDAGGGWRGTITSFSLFDFYFTMYGTFQLTTPFTLQDPTAILRSAMDSYISQGGTVVYDSTTTDLTATTVSYTFNSATIVDAIKKCLELAPADWYYYVDPGTDTLYFKQTATTATHKLILGRHLTSVRIRGSVEPIVNKIIFSGGLSGATNIFTDYINQDSIDENNGRIFLRRMSDNRVTTQATADVLGNNALDEHPSAENTITFIVPDTSYDNSLFDVGETVTIEGYGNFIDSLILQITQKKPMPDFVELTIGPLLKATSEELANQRRAIIALQTVANPAAPS
jgi:hypothetical protein